jgi:hypothetical protein
MLLSGKETRCSHQLLVSGDTFVAGGQPQTYRKAQSKHNCILLSRVNRHDPTQQFSTDLKQTDTVYLWQTRKMMTVHVGKISNNY